MSVDTYTFEDYLALFRRRRMTFAMLAVPIICLVLSSAFMLPDYYRSSATININLEGPSLETLEPVTLTNYADEYLGSLEDKILSYEKLAELSEEPDVIAAFGSEMSKDARVEALASGTRIELVTQTVRNDAGKEMDLIKGFTAGIQSRNPKLAHAAATSLANAFLDEDRAIRIGRASSTTGFLTDQLSGTESKIVGLEKELAEFKVRNACCLPELMRLNSTVIERTERDLDNVRLQIRTTQQDRIFAQSQLREIQDPTLASERMRELEQEYLSMISRYGPDHPDVIKTQREIEALGASQGVASDSDELIALRIQLGAAQRKYTDQHPDVLSLKRRIQALEGAQNSGDRSASRGSYDDPRELQLRARIDSANTQLRALNARATELQEKIDDYESRLERTPQIESEYQALIRRMETARQTFEDLQNRQVLASQTQALEATETGARLTLASPAYMPRTPSGPPRLAMVILGSILALALGTGAVILGESTDQSIRSHHDLRAVMDVMPIAMIPVVRNVQDSSSSPNVRIMKLSAAALVASIIVVYVLGRM